MAAPVVSVRGLTKVFDGVTAVDHITFDLHENEIVGLLGQNGAGKTTLIQMLLGALTPTRGEILIFGQDLRSHREAILHRVNFASTYVSLPYSLSVIENLTVFARLYNLSNRQHRIEELLVMFELDRLRHALTGTLSSGQLTRLCLAKALLNTPEVLFLDEPTLSLDPAVAYTTRRILKQVREETGMTLLCTSHNMREMEELCDRILFISHGRITVTGTPRELMEAYKERDLEEVFLRVTAQERRQ